MDFDALIRVISKDGCELSLDGQSTVVALGTFDGVHLAHRGLLQNAVIFKEQRHAKLCGAFCFYSSPISYLRGVEVPMICTFEQKLELMFDTGIDFVAVADFAALCDVGAERFVNDVLVARLGCVGAVCGFNHRFGKGGLGDSRLLGSVLGQDAILTYPEVKINGETVSSTAIREHLSRGEVSLARRMLGRPYSLVAPVLSGKKLGRTIGCPTANQVFPLRSVELKHGIYATLCTTEDGSTFVGASNVGVRPSIDANIDDHSLNCETLLADFSRDVYGEILRVDFYEYLREERKFDSLSELSSAIRGDLDRAVEYFKSQKLIN
ncbi:MAG: riboflavin biosynthesis protein RibF [Ruminococcaceae bacterium]|nr:riboflavin biosynthesis protein RibF [Oscillospiraceae bacterium]